MEEYSGIKRSPACTYAYTTRTPAQASAPDGLGAQGRGHVGLGRLHGGAYEGAGRGRAVRGALRRAWTTVLQEAGRGGPEDTHATGVRLGWTASPSLRMYAHAHSTPL